MKRRKNTMD